MYGLNIGLEGRCLSASPANVSPAGVVMVTSLPDGDLYDYRYTDGVYLYDPLPKPEPVEMVSISADELADLKQKAEGYNILTEGL